MKRVSGNNNENRNNTIRVWIGVCFCVLLLLITGILSIRTNWIKNLMMNASSPVQSMYLKLEEWIVDHTDNLKTLQEVVDENNELKARIAALEEENLTLKNQARRVSELEEILQLNTFYKDYPTVAAQIVGLSPNNWYETFILDKGSKDGIVEYMPVLSSYGLAGHVSEIYDSYCSVTSIVNQDSVVYGQINRQDGDLVIVQGAYGCHINELGVIDDELCMIKFVSSDIDITVGDEIVTSSLGDIYPPGLSIGTVIEIVPVGTGYESIALVQPTSTLDQTETVLIITELWKAELKTDEEEVE